jgi:two-component system cell cycle sensor histidine kinase/response regulator CckA
MLPDRQFKILLVEDNRIDREIYKQCLCEIATSRFEFAEAASAAEGIQLAEAFRPDCILLDYDLPDRTGLELLAHFSPAGPPGAVVMLTALGGEGLAVQAMKAGVTDYLPKRQVNPESLMITVTNAIRKFEMERRIEQQREALERSERRYETLLAAMPQMVWTADAEGIVEYANHQWLEYTGLNIEHRDQFCWNAALHSEDFTRTAQAWERAVESASVFEIEHRLRRASDGSYRWHLVRAVPMKNGSGTVINWFGTSTEVENQKQAEKVTLEREKLEGLGLLAGGIAHDFNNLLVSVLGGASLVLETLPAKHCSREVLNDVIRAGERAADLTKKMLAYSGRGNLFVEHVDLHQLARETCRFLRRSLPLRIQLNFESSEGPLLVETDTEQLRQVIVELVMNGAEAIGEEKGNIWVRCRRGAGDLAPEWAADTAASENTNFALLEVQDTGCGMDETTQSKIFDPFFSTKFTGRGLGLSAVKGFVRSNGGAIQVRSMPGEGAIFQVVLPCAAEKPQEKIGVAGSSE